MKWCLKEPSFDEIDAAIESARRGEYGELSVVLVRLSGKDIALAFEKIAEMEQGRIGRHYGEDGWSALRFALSLAFTARGCRLFDNKLKRLRTRFPDLYPETSV